MVASTPRPVSARNPLGACDVAPLPGGGDDRPGEGVLAVGLDAAQRGAAPRRRRWPAPAATPVTTWAPLVSVPVLSNRTVSTVRIRSSARRSLTRMPFFADTAVDSAITSGMARPRACGQAITSTVTVRTMASSTSPSAHHTTNVMIAAPQRRRRTAARRSGRRAPAPARGLPARRRPAAGSRPGRCRRRRRRRERGSTSRSTPCRRRPDHRPSWRPACDSPVIIDSSSSASPSTMAPSAGTRPPARTSTTSPTRRSSR